MVSKFSYNSKKYTFEIQILCLESKTDTIVPNSKLFNSKCRIACKNYNQKYSCPPYCPSFEFLKNNYSKIQVLALKVDTEKYPNIYNTIRMINVVLKSIQRKMFDRIDIELNNKKIDHKILENGSCRLCKKCYLQLKLPCKYPLKMRPSLEATGVDVNQLIIDCFGFPLQWYTKDNFPDYQCVVGGVLSTVENSKLIENVFANVLNPNQSPQYSLPVS